MTSIVAIRCKDGVVIGADSSATFGDGAYLRTVEQPTGQKIDIIDDFAIVAGTGYIGHHQRFAAVVKKLYAAKKFRDLSPIDIGKLLAKEGISDFAETRIPPSGLAYSAFVACPANREPSLVELPGPAHFQPEIKKPDDLWFASAGSGQNITDAVLTLFREVFWKGGAPTLKGGIFTAYLALQHVCEVNPGGVKGPVHIAVLEKHENTYRPRKLQPDDLAEHDAAIQDMKDRMAAFREELEGRSDAADIPRP